MPIVDAGGNKNESNWSNALDASIAAYGQLAGKRLLEISMGHEMVHRKQYKTEGWPRTPGQLSGYEIAAHKYAIQEKIKAMRELSCE